LRHQFIMIMNSRIKYLIFFSITLSLVVNIVWGLCITMSKTNHFKKAEDLTPSSTTTTAYKSILSKHYNLFFDSTQEDEEEVEEIEFGSNPSFSIVLDYFQDFFLKAINIESLVNCSFLYSIKSLISLEIISPPPRLYWI
jgi:hypothetical protein